MFDLEQVERGLEVEERKGSSEWSNPFLHDPPPELFLLTKGLLEFIHPLVRKNESERRMQLFGMNLPPDPFFLEKGLLEFIHLAEEV